ncbi:ricin-type beta-trefoil lectin domain-containing protein [Beauveria bassiana ARSEF 2860]|uniref:Ricin-type beta-trefoil lectin domain-containing protein n=1 Tax=Beauveria bassiana (strain ARSEF 2860) TaxID=655819 RepID=J4WAG4_BEAB2|nr:ricin-type beta-trefoil lectin domain-containing protein [Beauveria bassiana ARSEF 2860]EJP67140.1 ricin-type beta-trefoil lectin domain-containing protein [Beauveria bassiana ARSEF 2860]
MLHASAIYTNLFAAVLAAGNPLLPRTVDKLNNVAFKEAQQRDDAATRALANVQIKTADDRCLFVDVLSGDSRANLTPLQIADCSSVSAGQGFDVVTKGKHNDKQDQALVVSTLTQACLSFDPRRPSDSQVHMFSCGGRADGGGEVSDSQLFAFNSTGGTEGTIALTPQNSPGQCLVAAVDKVVIAVCDDKDDKQKFTFGGDAGKSSDGNISQSRQPTPSSTVVGETPSADVDLSSTAKPSKSLNISTPLPLRPPAPCSFNISTTTSIVTVTTLPTQTPAPGKKDGKISDIADCNGGSKKNGTSTDTNGSENNGIGTNTGGSNNVSGSNSTVDCNGNKDNDAASNSRNATATTTRLPNGQHTANPTTQVPVSGAGGSLNPTAAAAANQFDTTADRALESINLRAPDGRCLSLDPTAGDSRQNLIPVGLATCSEDSRQKFDVVTRGKHNDGKDGKALLVSVLTNGCLSFDKGETATSQLFPFDASKNTTMVLQPSSDGGKFCLVAGKDKLGSASCDNQKDQVFELVEVLQSTAAKLAASAGKC